MAAQQASKRFSLVLVKPSHYDDNGYLIQWHQRVKNVWVGYPIWNEG
jgi:hypothetical protein